MNSPEYYQVKDYSNPNIFKLWLKCFKKRNILDSKIYWKIIQPVEKISVKVCKTRLNKHKKSDIDASINLL